MHASQKNLFQDANFTVKHWRLENRELAEMQAVQK